MWGCPCAPAPPAVQRGAYMPGGGPAGRPPARARGGRCVCVGVCGCVGWLGRWVGACREREAHAHALAPASPHPGCMCVVLGRAATTPNGEKSEARSFGTGRSPLTWSQCCAMQSAGTEVLMHLAIAAAALDLPASQVPSLLPSLPASYAPAVPPAPPPMSSPPLTNWSPTNHSVRPRRWRMRCDGVKPSMLKPYSR